jgi:hypothetical protein
MRVGGRNAVDGPKDKQEVELFFAGALTMQPPPLGEMPTTLFAYIIFRLVTSINFVSKNATN